MGDAGWPAFVCEGEKYDLRGAASEMARDSVTHDEPPKVQMVRESHNMRWVGGVRAAAVTTTVNHAAYIQRSCMYGKPTNLDRFDGRG